jgi:hypothetical protein
MVVSADSRVYTPAVRPVAVTILVVALPLTVSPGARAASRRRTALVRSSGDNQDSVALMDSICCDLAQIDPGGRPRFIGRGAAEEREIRSLGLAMPLGPDQ